MSNLNDVSVTIENNNLRDIKFSTPYRGDVINVGDEVIIEFNGSVYYATIYSKEERDGY